MRRLPSRDAGVRQDQPSGSIDSRGWSRAHPQPLARTGAGSAVPAAAVRRCIDLHIRFKKERNGCAAVPGRSRWRERMKRAWIVVLFAGIGLGGCDNTMWGLGQDMQQAGASLSQRAETNAARNTPPPPPAYAPYDATPAQPQYYPPAGRSY
jgi:predicted small secreted protein